MNITLSEDEQLVPNITLATTTSVDPEISLYSQSNTLHNLAGNISNHRFSSADPNFDLVREAEHFVEQVIDLTASINELETERATQ
ncbi:MAG TPA: hypothetical protein ACHBX0_07785 [Arsenophonus sp.]